MALRKTPKDSTTSRPDNLTPEAIAFIHGANTNSAPPPEPAPPQDELVQVNMKWWKSFRDMVDQDVRDRGLQHRTSWVVDACAEKLERSGKLPAGWKKPS